MELRRSHSASPQKPQIDLLSSTEEIYMAGPGNETLPSNRHGHRGPDKSVPKTCPKIERSELPFRHRRVWRRFVFRGVRTTTEALLHGKCLEHPGILRGCEGSFALV
jgi:hypothetical protein